MNKCVVLKLICEIIYVYVVIYNGLLIVKYCFSFVFAYIF